METYLHIFLYTTKKLLSWIFCGPWSCGWVSLPYSVHWCKPPLWPRWRLFRLKFMLLSDKGPAVKIYSNIRRLSTLSRVDQKSAFQFKSMNIKRNCLELCNEKKIWYKVKSKWRTLKFLNKTLWAMVKTKQFKSNVKIPNLWKTHWKTGLIQAPLTLSERDL